MKRILLHVKQKEKVKKSNYSLYFPPHFQEKRINDLEQPAEHAQDRLLSKVSVPPRKNWLIKSLQKSGHPRSRLHGHHQSPRVKRAQEHPPLLKLQAKSQSHGEMAGNHLAPTCAILSLPHLVEKLK